MLAELYGRMKDQPAPTDLEALWQRLGIERVGRSVRFIDDAPGGDHSPRDDRDGPLTLLGKRVAQAALGRCRAVRVRPGFQSLPR